MKKFLPALGITAACAAIAISAVATGGLVQKSLLYEDIKITLEGKEIKPHDVNGNYIEPFIIEGTTYLPVRGIASSLGLTVNWDGDTNTVILDDPTPDIKSVLYEKGGIKISYTGMENGTPAFFVQNDSAEDITLRIAENSKNGKKYEYLILGQKKANILVPSDKTEFSFAVVSVDDPDKAPETEFTLDAEKAEVKRDELAPFEVTGEVTWETFAEFFKTYKDFENSGFCISTDFFGESICEVGSLIMNYGPLSDTITLDLMAICNIKDPVLDTEVVSPVSMTVSMKKGAEEYTMALIIPMNDDIYMAVSEKINPADGSVSMNPVIRYNNYFNYIDQRYTTMQVLKASERMAEDISKELLNLVITNGNAALAKKANGLKLEQLGLKSKGE